MRLHAVPVDSGWWQIREASEIGPTVAEVRSEEYARRIVAAMNAVEGIPTEALEGGVVGEMVEVLDDARRVIDSYAPHYARLITRIDAALAKVRGGAS